MLYCIFYFLGREANHIVGLMRMAEQTVNSRVRNVHVNLDDIREFLVIPLRPAQPPTVILDI